MNKERILEVADVIDRFPDKYDQENWGEKLDEVIASDDGDHDCGTNGCVAGWTCAIYDSKVSYGDQGYVATTLLDLTRNEARDLFDVAWPVRWADKLGMVVNEDEDKEEDEEDFFGEYNEHKTFVPTAEQAVEVLRYIGKNGCFPE